MAKIRLGISSCLLGEKVRYDGGHKLNRFCRDDLGGSVEFVAVCPEADCGLGVPREPMHLTEDAGALRLIVTASGLDHTERMRAWCRERVAVLAVEGLSGFVLKCRSPSCGLAGVPIHRQGQVTGHTGHGIFAGLLRERFPDLALTDEERLGEPALRERFLQRIGATAPESISVPVEVDEIPGQGDKECS